MENPNSTHDEKSDVITGSDVMENPHSTPDKKSDVITGTDAMDNPNSTRDEQSDVITGSDVTTNEDRPIPDVTPMDNSTSSNGVNVGHDLKPGSDVTATNDAMSTNDVARSLDVTLINDGSSSDDVTSANYVTPIDDAIPGNDVTPENDVAPPSDITSGNDVTPDNGVTSGNDVTSGNGVTPSDDVTPPSDVTRAADDDDVILLGTFRFDDVRDDVADYDSDVSFCGGVSDGGESDGEESDESGDEGDYDLEVAEGGARPGEEDGEDGEGDGEGEEDEVDCGHGDVVYDGPEPPQFPWREFGVVDLETASKWDFATLTTKCRPVVKETVDRVISFTNRLRRAQEFYAKMQSDTSIRKEDLEKIFLNIEEVIRLHTAILGAFRQELLKRPSKPRLGRVFKRLAPFLRLHEQLACSNTKCRQLIDQLEAKNHNFKSTHDRFKATGCKLNLGDILYEPYKYLVDLKEQLKRYLTDKHTTVEDQQDATETLAIVEKILSVIDEKSMKYHQNNTRMLQMRPIFKKKKIEIMKAHRILKLEGRLKLISPQTGALLTCEVFLFNDILVLCTPYLVESWLSSVRIIGLRRTLVTQEGEIIVVYSPTKVVELQISEHIRDRWFQALTEAANPPKAYTINNEIVTVDAPLGSRAPRFSRGNRTRTCLLCAKTFTRRARGAQHCHACGKVVCKSCSDHKVSLLYRAPDTSSKRVCDPCWRHLQVQV